MIVKGREKISIQHLLVRHYFLQRLKGVVILVVNWEQHIRLYHLPITSGTKTPSSERYGHTSPRLCLQLHSSLTCSIEEYVFTCEPKRKATPGIGRVCLFPLPKQGSIRYIQQSLKECPGYRKHLSFHCSPKNVQKGKFFLSTCL